MGAQNLEAQQKRVVTLAFKLPIVIVLVGMILMATGPSASARAVTTLYRIVNANDGIYWRAQPDWNTAIQIVRHGVYTGDQVALECYAHGGTVPPYYNNPLWYKARVVAGYGIGEGYVNDHFIDTGSNTPDTVVSGVPACDSAPSTPVPPTTSPPTQSSSQTVINGVQIGWPQNTPHRWGACNVQDFKGNKQYRWVIAFYGYWDAHNAYHPADPVIIHDGILFGWFDVKNTAGKDGAEGPLGCPLNNQHDAGVGVSSVVMQDFQGGSLLWAPGMDHAVQVDFSRWGAVSWALQYLGTAQYAGWCLQFVVNAYNIGQFQETHILSGGPYSHAGFIPSAYQWWYGDANGLTHPNDSNAPFGSFVVWDRQEARDGSGHIALGLGGGYMLTTEYGRTAEHLMVHIEQIAPAHAPKQNDPNYFGWEWPE